MQNNKILSGDLLKCAKALTPLFCKLKNRSILITGGTGFIGKFLLNFIIFLNQQFDINLTVSVITRDPQLFVNKYPHLGAHQSITFFKGDVRNFQLSVKSNFDYLIHGATPITATGAQDDLYDIITSGTKHTIEQSKIHGVKRMLFLSSGAVYGVQPSCLQNIPENFSPNPNTVYGRGKLSAEDICNASGLDVVSARCFAFVGPYLPLNAHFAIGNFIRDCLLGKDLIINGDGRPYRTYMYITDLQIWLWTLLLNGVEGEVYNVGSEEAIDIKSLALKVASIVNPSSKIHINGTPDFHQPAPRYVPSTQKAQKELGLKLTVDIDEAIKRTVAWNAEK